MSKQFAQPPTTSKALRLLDEGGVTEVTGARVFDVASGERVYHVVLVGKAGSMCNCEYGHNRDDKRGDGALCSHVLAARLHVQIQRTPDPFSGLAP